MSSSFIILAVFLLFATRRTLVYLHIFQQDEYDPGRFTRWLWAELAIDRKLSLAIALCAIARALGLLSSLVALILTAALFVIAFAFEANPKRSAKKPLAMTNRAKRIYAVSLSLSAVLGLAIAVASAPLALWIVAIQAIPFTLAAATMVLSPVESKIQRGFWQEAHEKLLSLKPMIIGVTGSYGKTSVKHILGHILETQAPTLITPGSVNTPMGIARIVRERLTRQHKFFICEMGAYGPGSISRLCDLAPPQVGVIVSIGLAHHERFKTLDTVAKTKFELAEAVARNDGKIVVSEDFLAFAYSRTFVEQHAQSCILVGANGEDGLRIVSTVQGAGGVEADVLWQGKSYHLRAPLFGEHHAFNIAIAFAAACAIGVAPDDAVVALGSTPQIKHRLEVRREPSGQVIVDDAYNSNPIGFANALRLLDTFSQGKARRVLMTPGMVELGSAHDEQHEKIGELAARHCDVFLAVKPERIPSMLASFTKNSPSGELIRCASLSDAQEWLRANLRPDDVVLIENDLPDLYERRLRL